MLWIIFHCESWGGLHCGLCVLRVVGVDDDCVRMVSPFVFVLWISRIVIIIVGR